MTAKWPTPLEVYFKMSGTSTVRVCSWWSVTLFGKNIQFWSFCAKSANVSGSKFSGIVNGTVMVAARGPCASLMITSSGVPMMLALGFLGTGTSVLGDEMSILNGLEICRGNSTLFFPEMTTRFSGVMMDPSWMMMPTSFGESVCFRFDSSSLRIWLMVFPPQTSSCVIISFWMMVSHPSFLHRSARMSDIGDGKFKVRSRESPLHERLNGEVASENPAGMGMLPIVVRLGMISCSIVFFVRYPHAMGVSFILVRSSPLNISGDSTMAVALISGGGPVGFDAETAAGGGATIGGGAAGPPCGPPDGPAPSPPPAPPTVPPVAGGGCAGSSTVMVMTDVVRRMESLAMNVTVSLPVKFCGAKMVTMVLVALIDTPMD